MTTLTDHEFKEIRLRVERPALGTSSQVIADTHALLSEVLHLRAEVGALKRRHCPGCGAKFSNETT